MIKLEALRPLRPHSSRKLRFEDIDKGVELVELDEDVKAVEVDEDVKAVEVDEVVKAVEVVELMVTDRLQSTF